MLGPVKERYHDIRQVNKFCILNSSVHWFRQCLIYYTGDWGQLNGEKCERDLLKQIALRALLRNITVPQVCERKCNLLNHPLH